MIAPDEILAVRRALLSVDVLDKAAEMYLNSSEAQHDDIELAGWDAELWSSLFVMAVDEVARERGHCCGGGHVEIEDDEWRGTETPQDTTLFRLIPLDEGGPE